MNVKLMIQSSGVNTLKEILNNSCNSELKKLYLVLSNMRETGYEVIEDCLIDLKARKHIILGVDKKYTTKKMLENIYKRTKSVYIYTDETSDLEANQIIFEYANRAEVYLASGNISDSFFEDNRVLYTKIEYNLEDRLDIDRYLEYTKSIVQESKEKCYEKLSKELIEHLAETKAIFTTKQYIHNVMSISELLGDKKVDGNLEKKVGKSKKIPKIDLNSLDDIDINIDTLGIENKEKEEENQENEKEEKIIVKKPKEKTVLKSKIQEMVEEHIASDVEHDIEIDSKAILDIESMLFDKSTIKLDKKKLDKIIIEDRKIKEKNKNTSYNKKIDLSKVSNIIIELKDKPSKGREFNALKISNQIKTLVPDFFEIISKGKNVKKDDGLYKESNINVEIVDVVANKKRKDTNALLTYKSAQSFILIVSDELKQVKYKEGDLARIIKLSEDTFHIEIIPQEIEEYGLWKKLCNQELRGSSKRFGVM